MKKKILAVVLSAVTALSLLAGCGKTATSNSTPAANNAQQGGDTAAATYSYDIKIWCPKEAVEFTQAQVDAFNASNTDGITLTATIEAVSESDAATTMINDVESGADILFFAQDQCLRLIQAGAISQLGEAAQKLVEENNDAAAVAAGKSGEALYAYPLTADNGYFMFYDKSVIPAEDLGSVEKLIADCEAAGRTFSMENETSAWYIASWFFGTGCESSWVTDDEGQYVSVTDTFNSANGLIAAKGMYKLVTSDMYVSSSDAAQFAATIPAAVLISGNWNTKTIREMLGENFGVAVLPSFEVNGNNYHMGSYKGFKLLGVKPQEDPAKAACLHKLAQYLTNSEQQLARFNELGWGPADKTAQANDAVANDEVMKVILDQNSNYGVTQSQIHGKWWDIAKVIGTDVMESDGSDEALQAALQKYEDTIAALFTMTDDEKTAFSVIGAICGTNWDTDFAMTRIPEAGDAVYYSEALELKAGDEFKVRQGGGWDVNFGVDGAPNGDNIKVEEDGVYFVKLTTNTDLTEVSLELVKTSYFAWSAIGTLNGTNWDTDFELEIQADGTTYKLADVAMTAGTEFKVRQGHNWDVNYGVDGVAGGDNIKVEADGTYAIVFDSTTGLITLE